MTFLRRIIPVLIILILSSCKVYRQDILFQFDENFTEADLSTVKVEVEKNYLLKPSDRLQLDVFTNEGERLIDPNFEIVTLYI